MVHTATNRGSLASTRTLRIFLSIISNITFTKSYVNLLSICKGKTDSVEPDLQTEIIEYKILIILLQRAKQSASPNLTVYYFLIPLDRMSFYKQTTQTKYIGWRKTLSLKYYAGGKHGATWNVSQQNILSASEMKDYCKNKYW